VQSQIHSHQPPASRAFGLGPIMTESVARGEVRTSDGVQPCADPVRAVSLPRVVWDSRAMAIPEEEIDRLALEGNELAWFRLVKRELPAMGEFARWVLLNPAEAEDTVADAFCDLWKHRVDMRRLRVSNWLRTRLYRACLEILRLHTAPGRLHSRRRTSRPPAEPPPASSPMPAGVAGITTALQLQIEQISAVWPLLPPLQRLAISGSVFFRFSDEDMAAIEGVPVQEIGDRRSTGWLGLRGLVRRRT
jgi:DNA-directed RNA polymerase specialized sigma24 family protein